MVFGELVPKNWAISRRWPSPRSSRARSAASPPPSRPLIHHLNNTANRFVRQRGLEPAEELASPAARKSWSRWPGTPPKEGALEPDTAELFVRTLHLAA